MRHPAAGAWAAVLRNGFLQGRRNSSWISMEKAPGPLRSLCRWILSLGHSSYIPDGHYQLFGSRHRPCGSAIGACLSLGYSPSWPFLLLFLRLSVALFFRCVIHHSRATLYFYLLSHLRCFLLTYSRTGFSGPRARRPPPSRSLCLHARRRLRPELREQCFRCWQ